MRNAWREMPITVGEVKELIKDNNRKNSKGAIIAVFSVVAVLIGIVIWVAQKREKDLEEHYEYFDDEFDDLDENYDEFDESIYDDEDDDITSDVEYVNIKDLNEES